MRASGLGRAAFGGLLGLLCALGLAACGGGGGHDDGHLVGGAALVQGLVLETDALPPARRDRDYGPVHLEVADADDADLTWTVWSGRLPEGVRLEADGTLTGAPRERGLAVFSLHVTDGRRAGVATRAVAVDAFGIYARAGLVHGEAWRGHPVELAAAGAEGIVAFTVVHAESGGRLAQVDVEAGRAVWIPGGAGEGLVEDVIEAYDEATGRSHRVTVMVRDDPMEPHQADFSSTDVWYVNTSTKRGDHAFAYDFHAYLSMLGLRGRTAASHDAFGRCVDMMAAQCVRIAMLRELDRLYLRDRHDGSALPVSFPYHQPGEGFVRPATGTSAPGAPGRYNEICLAEGGGVGALGTALTDYADNRQVENDTSVGELRLGVFLDVIQPYYRFYYRSSLEDAPIGPEDADALHALLHDLPDPGGRFRMIRLQVENVGRVLAIVAGHEIGHSLGLGHTPESEQQSLMSPSALIRPWDEPRFTDADLARLRARLPGAGRGMPVTPQALQTGLPAGIDVACPRGTCHLCPPPGVRLPLPPRARRAP